MAGEVWTDERLTASQGYLSDYLSEKDGSRCPPFDTLGALNQVVTIGSYPISANFSRRTDSLTFSSSKVTFTRLSAEFARTRRTPSTVSNAVFIVFSQLEQCISLTSIEVDLVTFAPFESFLLTLVTFQL